MATSRMVDHVGRVLGGRYRLLAPIGTGASAHVFLGEDALLRRRVAVKVLHSALAKDESFLRRFRAEATAAANLNHPNIMRVFDWGEAEDGPYLVLEHLGGGSLRNLLDRGDRLTPSQALLVGLEAARALDYAHRRGLVHRDIKPANLLFDDEGRLCVADFGLARALAEAAWTEPAGALLGTARYASPEQAQGSSVDGRSDVYSLALVIVESVTGRTPFAADTTIATLMARVGARLEPPAELGPLGSVVAAAAEPDPADRLDAAALVGRLDAAATQLPAPEPLPLAGSGVGSYTAGAGPSDLTELGAKPAPFDQLASQGPHPPPAAKRRRRWPVAVLAVVVSLIAFVGGGWALLQGLTPSHAVPTLTGKPLAQAATIAHRSHFRVHVSRREFSEDVALGAVISQRPATGSLKERRAIAVVVSKGAQPRPVPALSSDDTEATATAKLQGAGFKANVARRYDEAIQKDHVLDWQPRGMQPKGAEILLTVSDGAPPRNVPDLRGQSFDDAATALRALGLVAVRADVFSDSTPVGQVDSTSPAAGSAVAKGSKVTVNVSKGPDIVSVPDVTGQTADQATATLAAVGLNVDNVFGPPRRHVFLTDPAAGAKVKRGSGVNLYTR